MEPKKNLPTDDSLGEITETLRRIEAFLIMPLWRRLLGQVLTGMAFALGTALGLALLSWLTFNYFKNSEVLSKIVAHELEMRNLNISAESTGTTK